MLLSVGFPVTVTCDVMSKERPISSSFGLRSTKETFWMSGRPSMLGLIEFADRTRDSAMEYGAAATELIVAGVGCRRSGAPRCPTQYEAPTRKTTAAASARRRGSGRLVKGTT